MAWLGSTVLNLFWKPSVNIVRLGKLKAMLFFCLFELCLLIFLFILGHDIMRKNSVSLRDTVLKNRYGMVDCFLGRRGNLCLCQSIGNLFISKLLLHLLNTKVLYRTTALTYLLSNCYYYCLLYVFTHHLMLCDVIYLLYCIVAILCIILKK